MNGWHETWNDEPGPDVVCGHLVAIANPPVPADPPAACKECLLEGTTWVELRRCLVCGHTGCCESSPRRHANGHFLQTSHPVMADQSGGDDWGWCYVDEMALSPGDE
jgi:hypothetical protein